MKTLRIQSFEELKNITRILNEEYNDETVHLKFIDESNGDITNHIDEIFYIGYEEEPHQYVTILGYALFGGCPELVEFLIRKGSNVNIPYNLDNDLPLEDVCSFDIEVSKIVLKYVNSINKFLPSWSGDGDYFEDSELDDKVTILHIFAKETLPRNKYRIKFLKMLIDFGADRDITTKKHNETPLFSYLKNQINYLNRDIEEIISIVDILTTKSNHYVRNDEGKKPSDLVPFINVDEETKNRIYDILERY